MKPRLSVIVTAYNIEKYIERALASIVDQGFDNLEIIVVDDGSTDRTVELLSQFLRGEPNVRIILQSNAGPGAARNVGIQHARGDYIIFLDGDDWFAPRALESLWAATTTDVDLVLSNRKRYWERSGTYSSNPLFAEARTDTIANVPEVMKIHAIHGKLFHRRLLIDKNIQFPVGMSSEDFVFSYRIYAAANMVSTVPKTTYIYRKRDDSNNQSLTQARLTDFNLLSRFKQIEMTLEVVSNSDLPKRLPAVNFFWLEYESRLMRHVKLLPRESDLERRRWAFEQIRIFLQKHQTLALANCRVGTKRIYKMILAGKFDEALAATASLQNAA